MTSMLKRPPTTRTAPDPQPVLAVAVSPSIGPMPPLVVWAHTMKVRRHTPDD